MTPDYMRHPRAGEPMTPRGTCTHERPVTYEDGQLTHTDDGSYCGSDWRSAAWEQLRPRSDAEIHRWMGGEQA